MYPMIRGANVASATTVPIKNTIVCMFILFSYKITIFNYWFFVCFRKTIKHHYFDFLGLAFVLVLLFAFFSWLLIFLSCAFACFICCATDFRSSCVFLSANCCSLYALALLASSASFSFSVSICWSIFCLAERICLNLFL